MYLYTLNRPSNEDSLAQFECFFLTGSRTDTGYALSDVFVDYFRPAYIEACVHIYFMEKDIDSLYGRIKKYNYDLDNFRVRFINTETYVDFKTRKAVEREISDIFTGVPNLKNPDTDFVVTFTGNMWLFGKLIWETKNRWQIFNKKPHTFCNALPSRMARALVNIGAGNNSGIKLVDPCCGMGTVLLQALDMGINIYGCDINNTVVEDANENLIYFGFQNIVECRDAADIKGVYDVSIVDLPYGLLSKRGSDMHQEIISNVRKICSRAVVLSGGDISDIISNGGFKILDKCIVHKGGLDRHIAVCE